MADWGKRFTEWDYQYFLPAIAAFPPAVAWRLAALRGWIRYRARAATRRKALENLSHAFPEMSEAERREAVRRSFQLLSRDEMESYWFERPTAFLRSLIGTTELEVLEKAIRQRQGVLALTGHLGCLGIFLCWTGRVGLDHWMLFRPLEDIPGQSRAWVEFGNRRVRAMERSAGHPALPAGRVSYFRLRSILRRGGVITAAMDVVPWLVTQTVSVRFLGKRCRFPLGLARLYLDVRPAVVFWSAQADATKPYHLHVKDLTPEVARLEDPAEVAQAFAAELERRIRQSPGDWLQWDAFHYFWEPEGAE